MSKTTSYNKKIFSQKRLATSRRETLLLALLAVGIALITAVAYRQVLHCEFTNFDDNGYITENAHVKAGLSASGILWAFTDISTTNWHPLTWISHMLVKPSHQQELWRSSQRPRVSYGKAKPHGSGN